MRKTGIDRQQWRRLRERGWREGTVGDFLELRPEEEAYIELKLQLSLAVARWRREKRLTQNELAERLGSSQSRVAKVEAGDPSVSLDLLTRSLLAMGATPHDVAREILRVGPHGTATGVGEHPL